MTKIYRCHAGDRFNWGDTRKLDINMHYADLPSWEGSHAFHTLYPIWIVELQYPSNFDPYQRSCNILLDEPTYHTRAAYWARKLVNLNLYQLKILGWDNTGLVSQRLPVAHTIVLQYKGFGIGASWTENGAQISNATRTIEGGYRKNLRFEWDMKRVNQEPTIHCICREAYHYGKDVDHELDFVACIDNVRTEVPFNVDYANAQMKTAYGGSFDENARTIFY